MQANTNNKIFQAQNQHTSPALHHMNANGQHPGAGPLNSQSLPHPNQPLPQSGAPWGVKSHMNMVSGGMQPAMTFGAAHQESPQAQRVPATYTHTEINPCGQSVGMNQNHQSYSASKSYQKNEQKPNLNENFGNGAPLLPKMSEAINMTNHASLTNNQHLMSSSSNHTMASMSRPPQNQMISATNQTAAHPPLFCGTNNGQNPQHQQFEENFAPVDSHMQVDQVNHAPINQEPAHLIAAAPQPQSNNQKKKSPSQIQQTTQKTGTKDLVSHQGGMSAAEEENEDHHSSAASIEKKEVLNHMARLDYNIDTKQGGTLISFYQDYLDYLEEEDLVDPSQAQNQKAADTDKKNNEKQGGAKEGVGAETGKIVKAPVGLGDDEDLEGGEDPSEATHNHQRYRFDNVIKTMVARLELYNGLAPIQEYGRHQNKANAARKKKAQKDQAGSGEENKEFEHPGAPHPNPAGESKAKDNYNDQYYDLDDGFIDDEDIGLGIQEETDLLLDHGAIYDDSITHQPGESTDMMHERRQKKEDDKIVSRFRVLNPQEVASILEGSQTIEEVRFKQQLSLTKNNQDNSKKQNNNSLQSPQPHSKQDQSDEIMVCDSEHKANKNNNQTNGTSPPQQGVPTNVQARGKRDHDQAFASNQANVKLDDLTIDELLTQLKHRVLQGETLNHFKKEINVLVEQISKKESKLDGRFTDQVGSKLASILQKSDFEMQMMLRRTFYLNNRKERKTQVDKVQGLIKSKLEMIAKHCNRKSESDAVVLKELTPDFQFKPELCPGCCPDEMKQLCQNLAVDLQDLIMLNNKYVEYKLKEENAKAKRPKLDKVTAVKNQQKLEYDTELEKTLKQLSSFLNEACQPRFENRFLKPLFGLKVADLMPKMGVTFNQVIAWPVFQGVGAVQANSAKKQLPGGQQYQQAAHNESSSTKVNTFESAGNSAKKPPNQMSSLQMSMNQQSAKKQQMQ